MSIKLHSLKPEAPAFEGGRLAGMKLAFNILAQTEIIASQQPRICLPNICMHLTGHLEQVKCYGVLKERSPDFDPVGGKGLAARPPHFGGRIDG